MVSTMQQDQPSDVVSAEALEQRRIAKRLRVLKSAKIVFNDWHAIDCTLKDVSDTGAKLKFDPANLVPHKFRLFIAADNTIRDVQVAWKEKDLLGVLFTSDAKSCALRKF
jgi:2-succinyl-5-enolpyruvyl-6-hydroxy-3-cyclohexene-1-carboxylate synthase